MTNDTSMQQFHTSTQPPRKPSGQPSGANFTFHISPSESVDSAQKRANHNALERARRESLNNKFQELANAIPSLALVRRPSKSVIVQKSLDFVERTKTNADIYMAEVEKLRSENQELRQEVNMLRERLCLPLLPPLPQPAPLPPIIDASQDVDPHNESTSRKSSMSSPPSREAGACYDSFKSDLDETISTDEENESEGAGGSLKDQVNRNIGFPIELPQSTNHDQCSIDAYDNFNFRDPSFVPSTEFAQTLFLQDQSGAPSYANTNLTMNLSSGTLSTIGEMHNLSQFKELAIPTEVDFPGLEADIALMPSMPHYGDDQN
ncbi:hypothetical protein K493DRAFT_362432 [Basidiobolus meristosporus CBS 931.73]|uniref:BHLH domain-containing protein n=1 Tax=Basidiobolus meristosporus CBS 931.73 TaxID=1314790 RepID=A0A1Y1X3R9_9FUNG|nr:hypothetical protein K493DRAFT_362432 [Basidiobolus meristosporus CBS 931.73]|eukprot:ORX79954.1 hypothetical protein K493DRAFT_362432 [Basidiobolus meristosporus CBS 931.73]